MQYNTKSKRTGFEYRFKTENKKDGLIMVLGGHDWHYIWVAGTHVMVRPHNDVHYFRYYCLRWIGEREEALGFDGKCI